MGLGRLLVRTNGTGGNGTAPPNDPGAWWMGGPTVLPSPVSERSAQGLPPFWRGLAYVTGTVGMLPVLGYRGTDALEPQPVVLAQPDPRATAMSFWSEITRSLVLYGNGVALITATDRLGWPTALRAIHPQDAQVRLIGNPAEPDIGAWYVMGHEVDPSHIWHVRSYIGRAGWPLGLGLLEGAAEGISLAQALQDYAAGYFAGGALPTVALKVGRPELTQDDADSVRANYQSKFGGVTRLPAVLNSLTDIVPLASNATDAQMIEARQLSVADAALLFGLPPSKLGAPGASSTYRNAEQEERQARNDAIAPWCRLLEQAISLDLMPRGQRAEWNLDAHLRTDTLTRYQAYQIALGGPGTAFATVDEVRASEGWEPYADAIEDMSAIDESGDIESGVAEPSSGTGGSAGPANETEDDDTATAATAAAP